MNNQRALTAADHLVGNLYFDLKSLPLVAGRLPVDAMPPNSPATEVYTVMCELMRDPSQRLSAGAIEARLKEKNFDFRYLVELQSRILPEDMYTLAGYVDEINNAANLAAGLRDVMWFQSEAQKDGASAEQLKAELMRRVSKADGGLGNPLQPLSVYMDQAQDKVKEWRAGKIEGRRTGFSDLDRHLRLVNKELVVIAARPSMGKTSLGMQIVENVAKQLQEEGDSGCVAVFSAEMSGVELSVRMACAVAGLDSNAAQENRLTAEQYDKLDRTMMRLGSLPIRIDESPSPTTDQIYYRVAMMNVIQPVRLMLFDFVELGGDRGDTEELRISGIVKQLKTIAKTMDIPVLALSQINRKVSDRANKMPSLEDIRYSGQTEATAHRVVFIMRPEYYIKRGQPVELANPNDDKGVAYVMVAKNRNGPVGMVRMAFTEQYSRFGDLVMDKYSLDWKEK